MPRSSLAVLVPTRSRPANARRLVQACRDTGTTSDLVLGVDDDDPELPAYKKLAVDMADVGWVDVLTPSPQPGMVAPLNQMARQHAPNYEMLAFLGDDHVPRTERWDEILCGGVRSQGGGLVYGDDLLQRDKLPTAVVMESRIPRTLGYMAPPALWHLYADTVWLRWGQGIGRLTYWPDVVIEHLHPGAGTAKSDSSYATTNSSGYDQHDKEAFEEYCRSRLLADVARLR